jgi:uncharacterized membrane protein YkvA (DUF1232 family)
MAAARGGGALALLRLRVRLVAWWKLLRHPRTPWWSKAVALATIVYVLSPIDLIPDAMPFIGQLDDLALLALGMALAARLAPRAVWAQCLAEAQGAKLPRAVWIALGLLLAWLLVAVATAWWLWQAARVAK